MNHIGSKTRIWEGAAEKGHAVHIYEAQWVFSSLMIFSMEKKKDDGDDPLT